MQDATLRHEFMFRGTTYRAVRQGGRWLVIDGEVKTSGPTLVDAMESVFGPLYEHELTRIAVGILNQHSNG